MIKPHTIEEGEKKSQVMVGVVSMLAKDPEFAEAVNAAIVDPRAAVNRLFMRRAVERGEISVDCDLETLALITLSMAAYRVLLLPKPVDGAFLVSLIDGELLPVVGLGRIQAGATSSGGSAQLARRGQDKPVAPCRPAGPVAG